LDRYTLAKEQRENPAIAIEALPVPSGPTSVDEKDNSMVAKERMLREG
jgi:hypothetical protein